ncbi:MAG TPA: glucan biosynthesis protein, partial [Lamprocystis sp. (in: g-proteobacteria)]|nr:glucan biosynthesis protein [Lamprocystis sp. (in: g-proteobacteria)]
MWLPRAAPACFACLLLSAPVVAGAVDPPGLEADFAAVCQTAFARAQRTYQAPVAVALPAFDLPPTGEQDALGMVYQESLKITARHALYDDHTLWLRPRPRGGVERDPLDLWYTPRLGQPYRNAPYRVGDFDYSSPAIVPPLPAVIPEAARVLTAVDLGRRLGASKLWPQVMYIGANGYLRATGLTALFGSSLRLTAYNVGGEEVKPRLTKLYAKALAEARVAFFGVLESEPFTACVQAVATPGFSSRIETRLKLYPRPSSKLPANARVSPLAISSMFWKGAESTPADPTDQAHDADHLLVCGQGAAALGGAVPATPADPDQFLRFGPASCFGLMQLDRLPAHYARYADAKYARRVNYWVDDLQSDEPFSVDLYAHGTTYEGEDNLVAFVELQNPLPPALNAADGTSVRYSLTANLTPPPVRGPGLAFGESAAGDRIGAVVAVAGDTLAVGAPGIEGRGVVYRPGLVHLFRHYAG